MLPHLASGFLFLVACLEVERAVRQVLKAVSCNFEENEIKETEHLFWVLIQTMYCQRKKTGELIGVSEMQQQTGS